MNEDAKTDVIARAPPPQLFWPDDNLWYRAEVISLNERNRTAKVLYATSDVETLNLDELIREGHVNVRREA
jgi:hypothetical protein